MATSGVAGLVYGTTLIDLDTKGVITFKDIIANAGGGGGSVAWADITGKPAVIAAGADQAAARTAIGAGTSSLVVGTTASTAKAGNYVPAWTEITSKPTTFAPVAATASIVGGVKAAATQADSVATDVAGLVANFNDLLAKLKAAGIML